MSNTGFRPTHAVDFDLSAGRVAVEQSPRALIPINALESLCESAGSDGARNFGRLVGVEIGRRVAARLNVSDAGAAMMVEHLGGEIALLGFGSLGLERWGAAMVFTIATSPFSPSADHWLAGVFEGAMQRCLGRQVHAVSLPREASVVRVVIAGENGARIARAALGEGLSFVDVLGKLTAAEGSP